MYNTDGGALPVEPRPAAATTIGEKPGKNPKLPGGSSLEDYSENEDESLQDTDGKVTGTEDGEEPLDGARENPPPPLQQQDPQNQVPPVDGARQVPPPPLQQQDEFFGAFTETENAVYLIFQAVIRKLRTRLQVNGSVPRLSGAILLDYRAKDPDLIFPPPAARGNLIQACLGNNVSGVDAALLANCFLEAVEYFRTHGSLQDEVDGENAGETDFYLPLFPLELNVMSVHLSV